MITQRCTYTGQAIVKSLQLFAFKEPGVLANKTTKREFVFDVPLTTNQDGDIGTPLPGSWLG